MKNKKQTYLFTVVGAPVGTYEYTADFNNIEEAVAFGFDKFNHVFSVQPYQA